MWPSSSGLAPPGVPLGVSAGAVGGNSFASGTDGRACANSVQKRSINMGDPEYGKKIQTFTGKSFSEALIIASIYPQYDERTRD